MIRFLYITLDIAVPKKQVAIQTISALLMWVTIATAQAAESIWYNSGDPLNTQLDTLPRIPTAYLVQTTPCTATDLSQPLGLADIANASLCNNPQTQELWASTRAQAAQLGIAKSAYLPTVTNTTSPNANVAAPESSSRSNPYFNLSNNTVASYLLFDFGTRNATLENARQLLLAASASQNSVIQTVLPSAITNCKPTLRR